MPAPHVLIGRVHMNRRILCLAVGGLVVVAVTAPAGAQEQALRLPPDAAIDVVVKIERSGIYRGKPSKAAPITFRYRQELRPTAGGYQVTQTLVRIEPSPTSWSGMDAGRAVERLVYLTDNNLKPIRVEGWQAIIDAGRRRVREVAALNPELSANLGKGVEALASFSDEEAVTLALRDQVAANTGVWGLTGRCTRTLDKATGLAARTVCVTNEDIPESPGDRRTEEIVIAQALARGR